MFPLPTATCPRCGIRFYADPPDRRPRWYPCDGCGHGRSEAVEDPDPAPYIVPRLPD